MAETRSEQQPSDVRGTLAGLLVLAGIIYFAVVFWQLDDNRWWITLGVAAAMGILALGAVYFEHVQRLLLKIGLGAYDSLVFVLVVVVVVVVPITLDRPERIVLLKAAAIVYFSLIPALLYLQFSSRKTLAVWNDFVANLYKLDADAPSNLPRPSALSPFYERWRAARDRAWSKGWVSKQRDEKREQADERLEETNPYSIKFRDLFGEVPKAAEAKKANAFSVRSTHKLQVVVATALIAVGWAFVLQPEGVFAVEFPASVTLTGMPEDPPTEAFAFGFLGAYFYVLQMLVRRYFQNDLKSTAYINATMRLVIVILLVWTVIPLLEEYFELSDTTLFAIAFVIGVFPSVGWQFLQQTLIRKPIGLVVDSLEPKHKLGDLDGLNIWYESRLLEVGIEDMQNLATTDIVDLMLNTRIPVDRIVDWIDQAFLYVRVTDEKERNRLRRYGIRTVTDLDDVLDGAGCDPALDRLLNLSFDPTPVDDKLPSRIRAIHSTTHAERNLRHVRAWKHAARPKTERKAVRLQAPPEEPPAAAAPQPA